MILNIGQLKHKVNIYRVTDIVDSEGFKKREEVKILSCYAALEKHELKDENFGVKSTIAKSTNKIQCVIRYANVLNTDKIEINGVRYAIKEIEDINFERRFLRIVLENDR